MMPKHAEMVREIMERAIWMNRSYKDGTEFGLTKSDMKRLRAVEFPLISGDLIFSYSEAEEVLRIECVPPEPTGEVEPTTESIEEPPVAGEEPIGNDILMWIGYAGYPTIEDFVSEADRRGISKRISRVPKNLELGKTRVFLAHDEGVKGDAVIFGYFTVEKVEVLVEEEKDLDERLFGIAVPVLLSTSIVEPERGGGHREEPGAIYLVRYKDDVTLPDEDGRVDVTGGLITFDEPRDYNLIIDEDAGRYRSYRRVDGDVIIQSNLTKEIPTKRAEKTINLTKTPNSKQKWTDEEKDELIRLVNSRDGLYSVFKEFSRQTNRSLRSVEYQYFKNLGRSDG